jgi:hypothetical protein
MEGKKLIFLPLFPIYKTGTNNMMIDMADYAYDDLKQQGAFNWSKQQEAPQQSIPSEMTRVESLLISILGSRRLHLKHCMDEVYMLLRRKKSPSHFTMSV